MVIRANHINQIRFDVANKIESPGEKKNYKELVETIGWSEDTKQHVLILKLNVYSIDFFSRKELIGYTVKVINAISQTTIEQDRVSIISYIDWLLTEANDFLRLKVPIFQTLEFEQFDSAKQADRILDGLKRLGWYT